MNINKNTFLDANFIVSFYPTIPQNRELSKALPTGYHARFCPEIIQVTPNSTASKIMPHFFYMYPIQLVFSSHPLKIYQ